jgi:hypothetical protein
VLLGRTHSFDKVRDRADGFVVRCDLRQWFNLHIYQPSLFERRVHAVDNAWLAHAVIAETQKAAGDSRIGAIQHLRFMIGVHCDQETAGFGDPDQFYKCPFGIRQVFKCFVRVTAIKGVVGEWKRVNVTLYEMEWQICPLATALRNIHHRLAEIHADDPARWGHQHGYCLRVLARACSSIENMLSWLKIQQGAGALLVQLDEGQALLSIQQLDVLFWHSSLIYVGKPTFSLIVCILSLFAPFSRGVGRQANAMVQREIQTTSFVQRGLPCRYPLYVRMTVCSNI